LRAATRDPLTGIHNRATFDGVIARETDLARRHGSQLSLLLVDADRFKLVNDTYGHLVGDCALKALAQTLAASIRGSDMVFRYGGEEFVLLLSGTPADGARRLAERVRASVEAESIRCEERTLRLTISLGVARYSGSESATELVERADIALYDAKRRGGNVVVVAEDVGTPGGEGGEAPPNPGGAPRS